MNKLIISGLYSFALFTQAISQPQCDGYFPFEEGVFFQQTHFDAKGNIMSVVSSTIDKVEAIPSGFEAHVRTSLADERGEAVGEGEYTVRCIHDVFHIHVNNLLNPGMLETYQSMQMTTGGEGIQMPAKLTAGQQLPKGGTRIDVTSEGLAIVTLNFEVLDRKVEGKETINILIGAFECYRIRETVNFQAMFLTRSYTTVGWYAKNVGLVRQETYDQKGQLSSRMELTGWGKL